MGCPFDKQKFCSLTHRIISNGFLKSHQNYQLGERRKIIMTQ